MQLDSHIILQTFNINSMSEVRKKVLDLLINYDPAPGIIRMPSSGMQSIKVRPRYARPFMTAWAGMETILSGSRAKQ